MEWNTTGSSSAAPTVPRKPAFPGLRTGCSISCVTRVTFGLVEASIEGMIRIPDLPRLVAGLRSCGIFQGGHLMFRKPLAVLGIIAVAACSGKDRSDQAAADSLSRDLQMSPADSSAALNDRPTTPPPTTTPRQSTPRPSSGNTATGSTSTSTGRSLAAGTSIQANTTSQISSRNNKAGETLTATVASDVTDSRGRVVIPAGSIVKMTISQIQPAENKSAQDGKIVLMPSTIEVGGKSYTLNASIESVEHTLQGRGVTAGDAAKVGVGAAAGAIAGRVLSGNKSGAIIGGVVGAAVGTGVAIETADRDVVVPAGAKVVLKLTEPMTL